MLTSQVERDPDKWPEGCFCRGIASSRWDSGMREAAEEGMVPRKRDRPGVESKPAVIRN